MSEKMKAAVMNGRQDVSIETRDIPGIRDSEVLIRIQSVGICGSDLHYYAEGKIGEAEVCTPFVLGHEAAGIIEATGKDVGGLAVGDLVAVEAGIPCGECEYCRQGSYNICPDMQFLATPPVDGVFAEYAAYQAKWVFKLPESMTAAEGAMIEPLAVGMHAAEIGEATLGDTAFIFGCGCIGLVTLLALKSRGVSEIYMCDMIPGRIQKAYELGATKVFHAVEDNIEEELKEITKGRGVDSVYEMTGAKSSLQMTVGVVKKGGIIVLVGLGAESVIPFDFGRLIWNEVQIRTCFRYKNLYPKAIRAIDSGRIDVSCVISDVVRLDEVPAALKYHMENKAAVIKMIVEM